MPTPDPDDQVALNASPTYHKSEPGAEAAAPGDEAKPRPRLDDVQRETLAEVARVVLAEQAKGASPAAYTVHVPEHLRPAPLHPHPVSVRSEAVERTVAPVGEAVIKSAPFHGTQDGKPPAA